MRRRSGILTFFVGMTLALAPSRQVLALAPKLPRYAINANRWHVVYISHYETRDQASDRQRLGCRSSEVDFCQRCDRRIATTPLHEQVATWAGRCSDICKFSQLSYHTRHGADKRSASILSPPYTLKIAKQSCTESAHSTFIRHHVSSNALPKKVVRLLHRTVLHRSALDEPFSRCSAFLRQRLPKTVACDGCTSPA